MNPLATMMGVLPYSSGIVTRQINAENPTGEKSGACRETPDPSNPDLPHSAAAVDLGRGWKVRPFIRVKAGATATLAEIKGPGCINEIFFTSGVKEWRSLILRMYWDDEKLPSVECPVGDFFAVGHDRAPHLVHSIPVHVGPYRACSCYWQMPFREHARITLENDGVQDANVVAYRILYRLGELPEEAAYFHAQWRFGRTTEDVPEHTIVDAVKGKGIYVGTYIARTTYATGWWGEGELKFYIDGDTEFPTLADNGTEDYFGGAWNFWIDGVEREFNSPFLGLPLAHNSDPQGPRRFSMYRWHILDGVGFSQDLRVTIQALGWYTPEHKYLPLADDFASVAYWYQEEPHHSFPHMPPFRRRWGG